MSATPHSVQCCKSCLPGIPTLCAVLQNQWQIARLWTLQGTEYRSRNLNPCQCR
jgi:hypothetical protein